MFEQFESKFIDCDGIRTHYIEMGEGDPLVLVHGGGAGADGRSNFADNFPIFARHMRVIAYDMVGFGQTDAPDPAGFAYTQAARTDHLISFIKALGLSKICLIGNSMGGTTACGAALKAPELIDRLVLMGAAVNISPDDMVANRDDLAAVMSYDGSEEGMRKIIAALTHSYQPTDDIVHYRHEASLRPTTTAAYKATMGWAKQNGLYYSPEQLASLTMPVLVLGGKNDVMVPVRKVIDQILAIPQAIGHVFPNCGHWVMIEYPEEFCTQTLHFFGKLD
ncbi:alpha/beta hydrolase fold [Rhizorhabdus wittichii RW1]|uniref:Alpha/beta hydrolase fold n=1 Tax=Rhizorhabdus wittichii (strain DSM 6014 / CCUG 31198 / JCM 15750 / NBRC 105917 / EY 4224 / RW1) TaxID=392499 RepID=A0A9J9HCZ0_RHIWR|nr:alpha/beta hydrolase fold [Rhizorhabdus wittichii RW1]4LXG_A Chain A, MCP Hydrolase [Rhizorhabdus wittichii RW1]